MSRTSFDAGPLIGLLIGEGDFRGMTVNRRSRSACMWTTSNSCADCSRPFPAAGVASGGVVYEGDR